MSNLRSVISPRFSGLLGTLRWLQPIALLLAVVLLAAGCGEDEPEPVDAAGIKAAWIYSGPVGNIGWNATHDDARIIANDLTGATTFSVANIPEDGSDFEDLVRDLIVTDGVNVVFGTAFAYQNAMEKMAVDFPDVVFEHAGGFKKNGTNFGNYYGRMYEPRYASGVAAALATPSGKMGYVAGFPFPEVIRGINAFTLGAQSINPEVTVEVVWTSSANDQAVEANAANALVEIGVDLIAVHQDTSAAGRVAQENGLRWIGYDSDRRQDAPSAFLTAVTFDWSQRYVDVIESVARGDYVAEASWGGLDDNAVGLAVVSGLSEEDNETVLNTLDQITKGDIGVFDGPLRDQSGAEVVAEGMRLTDDEMLTMNWFVEGVVGAIPRS